MENTVEVVIKLNGMMIVQIEQPINPDATLLAGLEVSVKGRGPDSYDDFRLKEADTDVYWEAATPIVVPKTKGK